MRKMWFYAECYGFDPKSTITGETPIMKATKHWFCLWIVMKISWKNGFSLDIKWLETKCIRSSKIMDWRRIRASCGNAWLRLIDVPLKVLKERKKLYVWFDAWLYFIYERMGFARGKDWEPYWKIKIQNWFTSLGKTIFFIALFFPAMLKAEGSYILRQCSCNEFWT
jgi:methionyl-tRNA synthetase